MKFPYAEIQEIEPHHRGFYRISHDAYHRGRGVSSSQVKKALVSRATYFHGDQEDTQPLAFGRAFHMFLLEPELFEKRYVPVALASRNSKAWDNASQDARLSNQEAILVDEIRQITSMAMAIRSHPEYAKLPKFDAEVMGITTDQETGLQIKCKTDLFGSAIVDFKTTSSPIQPADFLNDVVKWRYHVSAAFYQDIIAALTGERLPFYVVPVTKKAPFECEFYLMSPEILNEGRKLYQAGLRCIKRWVGGEGEQKRVRTLFPNARIAFATKDILEFIES